METISHTHLMESITTINGEDEMMDSDYDQTVPHDDDYDIDLDTEEVYSNAGDEEMRFDMGDDVPYDNDDLMLDEGEYQTATITQEEMVITGVHTSETTPFLSIEMNSGPIIEVPETQLTETQILIDSSGSVAGVPETQAGTEEALNDTYILSQHGIPGAGDPKIDEAAPTDAIEQQIVNSQSEVPAEAVAIEKEPESTSNGSSVVQPLNEGTTTEPTSEEPREQSQAVEQNAQEASADPIDTPKIHPIIVQFETNTLALFDSVTYINYAATDDNPYPEIPSMYILPDTSYYSKGFDELFGALRDMFGSTIGEDTEITMEFDGLELFLHEDNLLAKSISLSDLMDLHIRLTKQDGIERPDPLYIILSTQARFTKRYSELLTAAGEGKGYSQVSTYSPTNDFATSDEGPVFGEAREKQEDLKTSLPEQETVITAKVDLSAPQEGHTENSTVTSELTEQAAAEPSRDSPTASREGLTSEGGLQAQGEEGGEQEKVEVEAEEEEEEEEEELLPADEEPNNAAPAAEEVEKPPAISEDSHEEAQTLQTSVTTETYIEEVTDEFSSIAQPPDEVVELESTAVDDTEQTVVETDDTIVAEETLAVEETVVEVVQEKPEPEDDESARVTISLVEGLGNVIEEEELLEYEEEEDLESEAMSPNKVQHVTGYKADGADAEDEDYPEEEEEEGDGHQEQFGDGDGDADKHSNDESPRTIQSMHTNDYISPSNDAGHVDDESFSSATVVDVQEGHSPRDGFTPAPQDDGVDAGTPGKVQDQAPQRIQVYQYDDENSEGEGSADAQAEDDNEETYIVGESEGYQYDEATWPAEDSNDPYPQSYFNEENQNGYIEAHYAGQNNYENYSPDDDTPQDSVEQYEGGEQYEDGNVEADDNGQDDTAYGDAEGYDDAEAYDDYQEDVEYHTIKNARSPSGKRLRDDDSDVLDAQGIKRTRSH